MNTLPSYWRKYQAANMLALKIMAYNPSLRHNVGFNFDLLLLLLNRHLLLLHLSDFDFVKTPMKAPNSPINKLLFAHLANRKYDLPFAIIRFAFLRASQFGKKQVIIVYAH